MNWNQYLAERLREVLTEGKWVLGTNYKEQIVDLDWRQATQRIEDFNTIADLTFHIDYYLAGIAQVLQGGSLDIRDKYSFEYSPITSEAEWRDLVTKFCDDAEELIRLVEGMSDEDILGDFVDKQYGTYLRNLDVMIEHCYYHLGQVVLINKCLKTGL